MECAASTLIATESKRRSGATLPWVKLFHPGLAAIKTAKRKVIGIELIIFKNICKGLYFFRALEKSNDIVNKR